MFKKGLNMFIIMINEYSKKEIKILPKTPSKSQLQKHFVLPFLYP